MHRTMFTLFTLLQITIVFPNIYHKVFIYDDHKRGEPFHKLLTSTLLGVSTIIQEGHTVKQYPLVVIEKIPRLLNYPGKGHNVIGEIYEVDNKKLNTLDLIHGHPLVYFRRLENIQLKNSTANEKPVQCWTYFYNETDPENLKLPMISDYHATGDHFIYKAETTTINLKLCNNESTLDDTQT